MIPKQRFLELMTEKEKYETFFRKAPLPFQSLDEEGRFLDVNEIWLEIMGYKREEVIGQWFGDFLYDEKQRKEFAKNFTFFKKKGFIYNVQFKMKRKDAPPIFVSFDGKIAYDDNGNFKQTYCIFRDITQEKKLQEELEQIKWLLTRNTEDLYKRSDSSAYGDLTELNTDRTILDSVGKETLQKIAGETIDLLESSIAIYEKNGDYATGLFSSAWCRLLDSQSRMLCGDVSNREALNSGKWICHESCWAHARKAIKTGKVVDSPCAGGLKIYAVPVFAGKEVVGALSAGYTNPTEDTQTLQRLSEVFHIPVEILIEKKETYQKRPPYIIELAKKKIRTSAELIGKIVQLKITEKKLIQSELSAKSANKAKSQFLANMSHEIRTPLNGIVGFTDLLRSSISNGQYREYIDNIKSSADVLLELINDILDFSKIEAGKLELDYTYVDFRKEAGSLKKAFSLEAKNKGIDFAVEIDDRLPLYIKTDPIRVRQIAINLLSNAFKFTESGFVKAKIKVLELKEKTVKLKISVEDSGIGISEQDRQKIFNDFTQADGSTTRKYGGTGLGLTICNQLLEKMGTQLELKSSPGKGSLFFFTVNCEYTNNPTEIEQNDRKQRKEAEELRSLYPIKDVLVAEDDPINRKLIARFLQKHYPTLTIYNAKDGQEAVDEYKKSSPDLVLMDLQMPELNGYEAAGMIRSTKNGEKPLIIALTAEAVSGTREKCLANGMDDYIVKPFKREDFNQVIGKFVRKMRN